jgi:hypothetical protein
MIAASIRRGVVAGLLAGVLAGLFALAVAGPSMDAAVAIEEAGFDHAEDDGHAHGDAAGFSRTVQRLGLVLGTATFGAAMGAVFGIAAAWASGRLRGDAWARSCTLGAVAVGALVVVPAIAYPPNPPGVGDPASVGLRSASYLVVALVGMLLVGCAWSMTRWAIERGIAEPVARTIALVLLLAAASGLLVALPSTGGSGDFPAELLWRFRLGSIGTQVVLWSGIGLIHGLLSADLTRRPDTTVGADVA